MVLDGVLDLALDVALERGCPASQDGLAEFGGGAGRVADHATWAVQGDAVGSEGVDVDG